MAISLAVADNDLKDAETKRFEAELKQYEERENVIASFVYSFQISSPEQRAELWQELENDKAEMAESERRQKAAALEQQARPTNGYDAETLRYKAAVENLDLPPDVVEDLVEMFQSNDAAMRQVLWQRLEQSPMNKN
ncbi:MAG: hypothetical protein ACYSUD_18445 [Planctomycetota bacterium]